jgi:hypothetical protein
MSAIQTANSFRQASASPEPQLIQSVYRTPHLSGGGPESERRRSNQASPGVEPIALWVRLGRMRRTNCIILTANLSWRAAEGDRLRRYAVSAGSGNAC